MKNISFVIADMKEKKFQYGILLIQMIVIMLLLCAIFLELHKKNELVERVESITQGKEIYMVEEKTLENTSAAENMEVAKQGYEYLDGLKENYFFADRSGGLQLGEQKTNYPKQVYMGEEKDCLRELQVSDNFFEVYTLNIENHNRSEIKEIFENQYDNKVPVILGAGYKGYLNERDEFQDVEGNQYYVVGFLEKDSYYFNIKEESEIVDLAYYVIIPSKNELSLLSLYCRVLTYSFVVDNIEEVQVVGEHLKKYLNMDWNYISYSDQMNLVLEEYRQKFVAMEVIMGIILLFTIASIVATIGQMLSDNIREYAVHLLVGAMRKDIFVRIIVPFVIVLVVSALIGILVFGISVALPAGIFICLIFLIMFLYPIFVIKNFDVVTLLKER